ncbi:MAG TPA: UdgX family uracil-DNA binding protein [Steroidobacteraceae bacterium]|nr:UdgX family uracil-DNA binding protein [Steroidobacteraceae bacterium]
MTMASRHRTPTQDARSAPEPATAESDGTGHPGSLAALRDTLNECRRCDRWRAATQGVPGEGSSRAELMLVGEVPGDAEDRQGHPFVGPAGDLLDRALAEAGIDRESVFVTNAVKHFKFEQRGKRRLHVKPNGAEIKACLYWLDEELRFVAPQLVIALGSTAARALLGRTVTISAVRGRPIPRNDSLHVWVTVHPSSLLRIPEASGRRAEFARFVRELKAARAWLRAQREPVSPRRRSAP